MDPSLTLPCPICQTKRRRQSHVCPICQLKRRKRRRQLHLPWSSILKGRQANYLPRRNPNNVSTMPFQLTSSFTYIFINLNTNACLFTNTPDDGKPLNHGLRHIPMFVYLYLLIGNRQPRINVYPRTIITWTRHLPANLSAGMKTHETPFTTKQRLSTLLHYLNWSFTYKFIDWHENPRNSIYPESTFIHPLSLPELVIYPQIHRLAWKPTKLHLPRINIYPPSFVTWTSHLPTNSSAGMKTHKTSFTHVTSYAGSLQLPVTTSSVLKYPRLTEYPCPFINRVTSLTRHIYKSYQKPTNHHLLLRPYTYVLLNSQS